MKKLTTCIWLDNEAEEAANFYVSVFPDSKIIQTDKYLSETPSNKPIGSVLTVTLEILGENEFMLLNGGPYFKVSEAISFVIPCKDQAEMDYYYDKLSADPEAEVCGWLKDKFGVSWQIIPHNYNELMNSADEGKRKRMWDKVMQMKKFNLAELENA